VARARTGNKPYPQRAIRTDQYLFIINFEPTRWPMGTGPGYGAEDTGMPEYEALRENTFAAFGDMDASPTKAWIVTHRQEQPEFFDFAVGRRPEEELYDIQADPHCMNNLADDPAAAEIQSQLRDRLLEELRQTADPRVSDSVVFEMSPFTDAPPDRRRNREAAGSRRPTR
jgi:uncharacterized sulfatase